MTMEPQSPRAGSKISLRTLAELPDGYGTRVAFSHDGRRWASFELRKVHIGGNGTLERTLTTPEPVYQVAFGRDDRHLLLCPLVYDLEHGAWVELAPVSDHLVDGLTEPPMPEQLGIVACAWAPDQAELVAATRFQPSRELGVVDTYTGPLERLLLLGGRDRELRSALLEGTEEVRALAVSDHEVVAGNTTLQVWDRKTHQKVATLARHTVTVRDIVFSPDGRRVAAGGADGLVTVWATASWTLEAAWRGHEDEVLALAFDPREPRLATGGLDGKLRLWSLETPGRLETEKDLGGWVQATAFSPRGDRLAVTVWGTHPRLGIYALTSGE